jgi:hypothetical protein
MKEKDIKELIERFISNMKNYNDNIILSYEIDNQNKEYNIYHNIRNYNSDDFRDFLGKNIKNILYHNQIFNINISYKEDI